jgi:hypothetical protein
MTYDEKLCNAVEKLGLHIEPGIDTSAQGEYVVYSYGRNGALWGDDAPCIDHRQWLVIYVAPLGADRVEKRLTLMQAIASACGVWPEEDDFSDINGQRWTYQFDTIGGIANGSD